MSLPVFDKRKEFMMLQEDLLRVVQKAKDIGIPMIINALVARDACSCGKPDCQHPAEQQEESGATAFSDPGNVGFGRKQGAALDILTERATKNGYQSASAVCRECMLSLNQINESADIVEGQERKNG
jgi:hypothetical protein